MCVKDDALIVRVAGRGDGVTEDGRHVALTAPGDRVAADGVITPGPHHQSPPCRHFPACGGCQLQHLDDESWGDYIRERIRTALAAHGLETEIRAPALSPPHTRRRATLHAEKRGKQVQMGFTEQGSHALINLAECHVLSPNLFALIAPLKAFLARHLPANRRVDVHLVETDQGRDVLVNGVEIEGLEAAETLTAFASEHKLARFSLDEGFGPTARWEPDPVTVTLGGVAVPFPAGNFLQATPEGEAALVAAVREIVGEAKLVADLFAGLGTFTFAFPDAKIYAAEAAREPIMALKAAANPARRMAFADHRDLFRRPLQPAELDRFETVVIDPPRAGARDQATEIAKSAMPVLAYVSCNPGTFARDAEILCKGGYTLEWIQPVGQFRWSTHVELAAKFTRQG